MQYSPNRKGRWRSWLSHLSNTQVLDATTASECIHTREDIFVQVQTLLRLRDTIARVHGNTVEVVRVTIMQLAANPRQSTRSESSERLFLARSDVTKNTDILRENVLASTNDRNRWKIGRAHV